MKKATDLQPLLPLVAAAALAAGLSGQSGSDTKSSDTKSWTAAEDHRNMMDQLGIKALRPGPSGNESAPNRANYDEATANPYPNLPDVLTLPRRTLIRRPWNNSLPMAGESPPSIRAASRLTMVLV